LPARNYGPWIIRRAAPEDGTFMADMLVEAIAASMLDRWWQFPVGTLTRPERTSKSAP
jgi:hypothetical protein